MQGALPCITPEGKIIMESSKRVATSPDGNGGVYAALAREGVLDDLKRHGVEYVFQYCVDNILVKPVDPIFVGFLYEKDADVGCKVCGKKSPEEPVGVICLRDGLPAVVEYSEIDKKMAAMRDPKTNELVFNAAHLCINSFRIDFLEKAAAEYCNYMGYHIAVKKIPCVDKDGDTVAPDSPNGWKLEQFIFDVFPFANNLVALEIDREEEFSPLKNGLGASADSPQTCRDDLSRLHQRYITQAGGTIATKSEEAYRSPRDQAAVCEISPLLSFAGEDLEPIVAGKEFSLPLFITADGHIHSLQRTNVLDE